jgi:deoxyribodipyrimidine photolyase-related protein
MKSALILYPHQLYPADQLPKVDTVILVEEPLYFGVDQEYPKRLHKQKLVLHRASMRRYVGEVLWPAGFDVDYVELGGLLYSGEVLERTRKFDHVYIIDPVDDVLIKRLLQARRDQGNLPALEFLPNPGFYLKDPEVRQYFEARHHNPFGEFYQWQRERFNILIGDDYKPVGGAWSLEAQSPEKVPSDQPLPSFAVFGGDKHVADAVKYIEDQFPDNPGSTDFIWPTNHSEARQWLQDFVEHRLDKFGHYELALDGQAAWLYHSALSSSLNIGLLNPQEVIEVALHRHAKNPVNLASLESFIRHILGWREFARGQYLVRHQQMRGSNPFRHQRKLTAEWYSGQLGLPPFDDMVRKVNAHAYAHGAERLMIAGSLMLLAEIHPDEMFRWFGDLFIDAYDWAMIPSVYALSQFASGEAVPVITASNYILQMSNYQRGDWADTWDGLFWRFVEKHRTVLAKNPRMRAMVQRLDRLDPDRKRIIGYRADDFLRQFTH